MRFGSRTQYNNFLTIHAGDEAKIAEVTTRIEWINDNIWFIREANDTAKDEAALAKVRKVNEAASQEVAIPDSNIPNQHRQFHNPALKHEIKQVVKPIAINPPARRPPPFLSKAVQFLRVVTGPKVVKEVFDKRISKCTKEGGCTFAQLDGTITDVSDKFIFINGVGIYIAPDETPTVKVGDTVKFGQTITSSTKDKPCPMLNTKKTATGTQYFCGGCGCGERAKAELTEKLYYARVVCPRTPPQFEAEDENGPNIDRTA